MILTLSLAMMAAQGGSTPNSPNPQIHRGMAPAWAATLTLASADDELQLKPPGRISAPIGSWAPGTNTTVADFTFSQLVTNHPFSLQGPNSPVAMDAFSTGRSRIPRFDSDGVPLLAGATIANWMAIAVSVSNGSNGINNGHISRVRANQIDPGAEIIAHYLDPNNALDVNLRGKTLVETRRADLGFAQNGPEDITSLDYPLGALTYNQSTAASVFFTGDQNTVYFSVSKEWYQAGNTAAFADDGSGSLVDAHPGDIYGMTFSGNEWQMPFVHVSRVELANGTSVNPDLIDVDALDMDADNGVFLFSSTQETGFPSQLMVMQRNDLNGNGKLTSRPLKANSNTKLTDKLDISDAVDGDEADALCTFDPEIGSYDDQVATAANPFGWVQSATPPGLWATGNRVGISAARRANVRPNQGNPDDLHVLLTGYGGAGLPEAQAVTFFVGFNGSLGALTGWIPRSDMGPGDTSELIIPLPATASIGDVQLFGFLGAWDSAGNILSGYPRLSWASTLKL
ncbi:hypothetical protein Poly30_12330 [Planctomycetes bacterium Poly30]|uniref:Uncharacterized protein n=1 Tax=Saltatorellus ferox TaxID=2528018 RepID=A0A518ENR2_9BACT|nr:hypothetical protein Poly30_12330 [Planctomycetes bacterium Poly30]